MADQPAEAASSTASTLHGTVIALQGLNDGGGNELGITGVLIRGASGMGKSDLALRCLCLPMPPWLSCRCWLVADDYVAAGVDASGQLVVSALRPDMAGLLEVRGVGLVRVPKADDRAGSKVAGGANAATGQDAANVAVRLVVDLVSADTLITRLPDPGDTDSFCEIMGVRIARLRLHAFEASAPLKIVLAAGRRTEIEHSLCS